MLLGEKLIGLFLDQVEDHYLFAPWTPVQDQVFGLGLPMVESPAPFPVPPGIGA